MAPRKTSKTSSKVSGSIPVKQAASKQPKAKKSDAALPTSVYVVLKKEGYPGDGFHSSSPATTSVVGVYPSEEQAYFSAMKYFIQHSESFMGEELMTLRKIAANKTLSLKKRLKHVVEEGNSTDSEVVKLTVRKSDLFPAEKMDEKKLISGFKKPSENQDDEGLKSEDSEEEGLKEYSSQDSFDYL